MKIRRSFAIGLAAAALSLSAIGGASAGAATPQTTNLPSEARDVVITTTGLSSLETIVPTGLQNTLPYVGPLPTGPDARS
jgi:ABC-type glycerol-3-phosphate transport system substrate-binding protein